MNRMHVVNRRVLVTGCAGYIGQFLCKSLSQNGFGVVGVDRKRPRDERWLDKFVELDLSADGAAADLGMVMTDIDAVFHLAAARTDYGLSYEAYHRDNVKATQAVVDAGFSCDVGRWVYFGTVGVYGASNRALTEVAEFRPDSDYGATKAEAERLLLSRAHDEGWSVRVIRPSAVYSESQPPDTNLYRLIEAIRRRQFFLIGDGAEIKTTSYAPNVTDAAMWLYNHLESGGIEAFNYIDEPKLTTREIVGLVREELEVSGPLIRLPLSLVEPPARALDWFGDLIGRDLPITAARIRKFCTGTNFDASKIRRAGFEPRFDSYEGLRHTVRWHKNRGCCAVEGAAQ